MIGASRILDLPTHKTSGGTVLAQVTHAYDALDNRIGMDENGTQTWTLYDGDTPVMDFNGSGSLTMRYLWGPTGILARQTSGGTVSWYLADQLGTVRDLIDNSGNIIDHVDFSAFGTVLDESNPSNGDRFMGFAGLERDTVTGLNLAVEREENPGTGRWDSPDPLGFGGGSVNLSSYAANYPTGLDDPLGLAPRKVPVSLPPIRPDNTIVLNGPPHVNRPADNHADGRYRPYFRSLGVPDRNMFDFNSQAGWYSSSFRAAVERARQRTRGAGPPDIIIYVHGAPGLLLCGESDQGTKEGISLRKQDELAYQEFLYDLKLLLTNPTTGLPFGKLIILGCDIGSGPTGNAFLRQLETDLGVPVYGARDGSTDIQGPPNFPAPVMVIDPGGNIARPR